jgi:hypothetical protein
MTLTPRWIAIGLFLAAMLAAIFIYAIAGGGGSGGGDQATRNAADGTQTGDEVRSAGLRWGGRTFKDINEFKKWLQEHGVYYERWRRRHPDAAQGFEARAAGKTGNGESTLSPQTERQLKGLDRENGGGGGYSLRGQTPPY